MKSSVCSLDRSDENDNLQMFRCRRWIFILIQFICLIVMIFLVRWDSLGNADSISCPKSIEYSNEILYSNLIFVSSLNLMFCDVPKAASTNLRRFILSSLNVSNSFVRFDRKQIWIDYEEFFHQFQLSEMSKTILNGSNFFKFLLVRHPFRRIYSVYRDKFVENHFDDTLFGWKQFEEEILLEMKSKETLVTIRRNEIRLDLRTFLLFIIKTIREKRSLNSHWQQIVQRCSICLIKFHWFGKIESFHRDSKILLQKISQFSHRTFSQFPSSDLDQKQINERKEKDSFDSDDDQQLNNYFRNLIANDEDFHVLVDYYLPDFLLFNYEVPKFN